MFEMLRMMRRLAIARLPSTKLGLGSIPTSSACGRRGIRRAQKPLLIINSIGLIP